MRGPSISPLVPILSSSGSIFCVYSRRIYTSLVPKSIDFLWHYLIKTLNIVLDYIGGVLVQYFVYIAALCTSLFYLFTPAPFSALLLSRIILSYNIIKLCRLIISIYLSYFLLGNPFQNFNFELQTSIVFIFMTNGLTS